MFRKNRRWEYKFLWNTDSTFTSLLKEYGEEGWEAFSVEQGRVWFKRQIKRK